MKLQLDEFRMPIRDLVMNGRFSRSAYDIAIAMHYFGGLYKLHGVPEDKQAFLTLKKDLRHLPVADLRSQHLDYLLKGINTGLKTELLTEEDASMLQGFLPKLVDSIDNDLGRFSYQGIVHILTSFQSIYDLSKK